VEFDLLIFNEMLSNLTKKFEMEEHLSFLIRNIEQEFTFQSLGIFLKVPNSDIFRMKISRNVSHTFVKNSIFTEADPMIQELMSFKMLDIQSPGRYVFEKEYSHLLLLPLCHYDKLLGFIFIDKKDEFFQSEEMIKMRIYASVLSLIVQLDMQSKEIEQHREIYESANIYSHRAFVEKSEAIYSMMQRYNRYITIAVIKIDNYDKILRKIGKHEAVDLLKQITYLIKSDLRETDIIGKIHEDTFAILMPETSSKNGFITVNRVNEKLNKLPMMKVCKAGWGIATKDDKTQKAEDLVVYAEHAANDSNRKDEENITIYK